MLNKRITISVVAPMYNEESVIEDYIIQTQAVLKAHFKRYEIVLVDDGSTDKTIEKCLPFVKNDPMIRIVALSRNYGHEIASTAGFDEALGDYVVLMDTDLQHPPSLIPAMFEKANEGFDVVCAARIHREHESFFKRITARLFYALSRRMTGFELKPEVGNFRLLNRQVVESLKKMRENNRHLIMMFAYLGFKTTTIAYECPPRAAGHSKYTIKKLIHLSLDSIISFSARPLHMMSFLSIFISVIMFGYAGFILLEKLFSHQQLADGIASIIFLISGLFAVLFLFLAIISEYISRILIEAKNRPLYYIKHYLTHEHLQLD